MIDLPKLVFSAIKFLHDIGGTWLVVGVVGSLAWGIAKKTFSLIGAAVSGAIALTKKIRAARAAAPSTMPTPQPTPAPKRALASANAAPAPEAEEASFAAQQAARDHRQQSGRREYEQRTLLRAQFRELLHLGRRGTDRQELAGLVQKVEAFTAAALEFTGNDWAKAAGALADTHDPKRLQGQLLTLADIGRLAKTGLEVEKLTPYSPVETQERILVDLAQAGHPLVIENVRTRGVLHRRNKKEGRLLQFLSARRADWRTGAVKSAQLRNLPFDANDADQTHVLSTAKDGLNAHIAAALKEKQAMAGDRVKTPVRQGPGPLRRAMLASSYSSALSKA